MQKDLSSEDWEVERGEAFIFFFQSVWVHQVHHDVHTFMICNICNMPFCHQKSFINRLFLFSITAEYLTTEMVLYFVVRLSAFIFPLFFVEID